MKNNFLKILIFLFFIIFLFFCFIFVSLYTKTNQNNQKAKLATIAWQAETDQHYDINLLNNSLEQVSNERALLNSHFVQSSDVVPFFNTLEQLGVGAGASVVVDSVVTGTNNNELVVDLKTTGTFKQVYQFLTLLENSPYEITFNSMDLHTLSAQDVSVKNVKNQNWEADFEIQLLSFIP
jgi:Tfp pilus assembly protein PilO